MAPIRYSLHYEDYSDHLMSRFGKLLQMQSLVDMTLMCSSHTLRVHKVVLAASSAYFQEVLQKQNGEPLIILKMRFSVLKCLVEFMYCGKTQCLEENLDELVSAAQFLKIKGLSKVTKEGLGITNQTEIPTFTPPVVINRPPKSLLDVQESVESKKPPPVPVPTSISSTDQTVRPKESLVHLPYDVDVGGADSPMGMDYLNSTRVRPRRGRPTARRPGGWEPAGVLGRAAERALLRREQDSRKAIHQLKHLQNRQMQDYMDHMTLSQAVSSICGPESSTNNYINIDNDLLYMDQTSNIIDSNVSFSKTDAMGNETITSSYSQDPNNPDGSNVGIGTAMSQYVNALKDAGLPTDLPILFESGDGSYINVNEQVLLDMVQSNEIQYEVIEQPNIIEKVADPTEIKSIDELSKSIERGEMLIGSKNYASTSFDKDTAEFMGHEDAINSLHSLLPENLDSFSEQQNYVVLNNNIQEGNNIMNNVNGSDFSSIVNDMQFFTKSINDDMKNYYDTQQCNNAAVDQMCPTSTALDTNFNISFLESKVSHFESENIGQEYNTLNNEDLRRNEDSYDFSLQLGQSHDFKGDPLDCLISPTKKMVDCNKNKSYNENELNNTSGRPSELLSQEQSTDRNFEVTQSNYDENNAPIEETQSNPSSNFTENPSQLNSIGEEFDYLKNTCQNNARNMEVELCRITSGIQWDNMDTNDEDCSDTNIRNHSDDLIDIVQKQNEISYNDGDAAIQADIKNEAENNIQNNTDVNDIDNVNSSLDQSTHQSDLLPLQESGENSLKRTYCCDDDLNDDDAQSLSHKIKYIKP